MIRAWLSFVFAFLLAFLMLGIMFGLLRVFERFDNQWVSLVVIGLPLIGAAYYSGYKDAVRNATSRTSGFCWGVAFAVASTILVMVILLVSFGRLNAGLIAQSGTALIAQPVLRTSDIPEVAVLFVSSLLITRVMFGIGALRTMKRLDRETQDTF